MPAKAADRGDQQDRQGRQQRHADHEQLLRRRQVGVWAANQTVEVSAAKASTGLKLEEAILLQAELLDLKANPSRAAEGAVIEAKLDKGRGPVATVLVQRGTLKVGDIVVAGSEWGRVRLLQNDRGETVKEAGPSTPIEVPGRFPPRRKCRR